MSVPPVVCVHCRQPSTARYEITRFDNTGTNKGTVVCCSITCLITWAYEYSTVQGMRLAYGAKASFESFMAALRGMKP